MFDESKHPRSEDGKFTDGSGGKVYPQNTSYEDILSDGKETIEKRDIEIEDILGEEFKGVKGQAAVEKLLQEKKGHVKAAFHREDIGDIDLIWGNDTLGLQHIIKQREAQGIDVNEFLMEIPEAIEKGEFYQKSERGNFEFLYNGKMVIVAPEYHGKKLTFVLTAYKTRKKRRE